MIISNSRTNVRCDEAMCTGHSLNEELEGLLFYHVDPLDGLLPLLPLLLWNSGVPSHCAACGLAGLLRCD